MAGVDRIFYVKPHCAPMKYRTISWLLLIVAACVCYLSLRYFFGDFQGYLTIPINGTDYGFAHIKSDTEWVSGQQMEYLPGVGGVVLLVSIVVLVFVVRFTYRANIGKGKPTA
jgi:hypothetical protein